MIGYSKLIETDETQTRAAIVAKCRELVDPRVTEHHGHVVSAKGGSILAEFDSTKDAVQCGAEIQRAMEARNKRGSDDKRIQFRIVIDAVENAAKDGDVRKRGIDLAGPPVGMADAAGIFMSREARGQVEDQLHLKYEDLGEQKIKNLAKTIQLYRVLDHEFAGAVGAGTVPIETPWRWLSGFAVIMATAIGGAAILVRTLTST